MDLAKFVSLLSTRALYFPSVTELIRVDPFEGYFHPENMKASYFQFDKGQEVEAKRFHEAQLSKFGVSCWHLAEHESAAMWKLYSLSDQGVAIESTVPQVMDSFGKSGKRVKPGDVDYINFDRDADDTASTAEPIFTKRKSYEHEKEYRFLIKLSNPGEGELVSCDLEALIAQVHVSPHVPSYFYDAVKSLVDTYLGEDSKPVLHSKLRDEPKLELFPRELKEWMASQADRERE